MTLKHSNLFSVMIKIEDKPFIAIRSKSPYFGSNPRVVMNHINYLFSGFQDEIEKRNKEMKNFGHLTDDTFKKMIAHAIFVFMGNYYTSYPLTNKDKETLLSLGYFPWDRRLRKTKTKDCIFTTAPELMPELMEGGGSRAIINASKKGTVTLEHLSLHNHVSLKDKLLCFIDDPYDQEVVFEHIENGGSNKELALLLLALNSDSKTTKVYNGSFLDSLNFTVTVNHQKRSLSQSRCLLEWSDVYDCFVYPVATFDDTNNLGTNNFKAIFLNYEDEDPKLEFYITNFEREGS